MATCVGGAWSSRLADAIHSAGVFGAGPTSSPLHACAAVFVHDSDVVRRNR